MNNDFLNLFSFTRKYYENYTKKISLHEPVFFGNEKKYVNDAIDSTFVSSVGKYVDLFEKNFSEYTKSNKFIKLYANWLKVHPYKTNMVGTAAIFAATD